jgi:hypothetical protein
MARAGALCAVAAALVALPAAAKQEPSVEDMLRRAAGYVAAFQKQLSGIVAEESYEQKVLNERGKAPLIGSRRLKSDLLLVRPLGTDRYVEFRDVFEVDGRAVRDREERLTKLFLNPPEGARSQLERVMTESARYNIGRVFRTLNTPVLALGFLASAYQPQFSFKRSRSRKPGLILEFEERDRPTVIRTPQGADLPARGWFWIDPATGAVSKSEMVVEEPEIRATITVTYRSDPSVGFLVPAEMREMYFGKRDRIEGRATYGRFRKFQVQVDEQIKPVKQ